jgi:hypothetical protein
VYSAAPAGVLAAQPDCPVEVDFFPQASAIEPEFFVDFVTGQNVTGNISQPITQRCNGTEVCNSPEVWQPANQQLAAANPPANPWRVVLPKAKDATITFKVSSPYLTANASGESQACLRAPAPTRKLLADTNYTVSTAGVMSYTVKIGDGAATAGSPVNNVGGKITIGMDEHEVSRDTATTAEVLHGPFQNMLRASKSTTGGPLLGPVGRTAPCATAGPTNVQYKCSCALCAVLG